MQNKGLVTFVTSCLALICAFYISFSFVVRYYDGKAAKMSAEEGRAYLDSMAGENVWFGYTLKEARAQQIGLGLDLKGGMNVVLKLNAGDLLRSLANGTEDPNFNKAIELASSAGAEGDFINAFIKEYKQLAPNSKLSVVFGSGALRDQLKANASDDEVIALLRKQYDSAIDASYNVLRTRIDRFGVVAPNLQRLEGQGRILVELPGVDDPKRVRALLQRSANLQFWRTYTLEEVQEDLMAIAHQSSATQEDVAATDSVMRGGPGLGTIQPSQADYFQTVKGGGHGDYRLITLAPNSVQEMADFVGLGFDLAFKYNNPAIILADGIIGQMMEKVRLPEQRPRRTEEEIREECPWATLGRKGGRKPNVITSLELESAVMEQRNNKFQEKYRNIEEHEVRYEAIQTEDADYILVAFGSASRMCQKAVEIARNQGLKVGLLRPITLWPFPSRKLAELATHAKGFFVPELNAGQMVEDVRLAINGKVPVEHYGRLGGMLFSPNEILENLKKTFGIN